MRALLLVALGLAVGCAPYAVRVTPAPAPAVGRDRPLDLTVSLGELRVFRNSERVALDDTDARRIDAEFVRAVTRSGIVRAAEPRGSRTDLYCDVTRELHAAPLDARRMTYLFLAGPLAVVPGFPYPWDYRIDRTVRVRGEVGDATISLADDHAVHGARVWGGNPWGDPGVDPGAEQEGDYIAAGLAEAVRRHPALFEGFASAARTGDVETAWMLGETAAQEAVRR